MVIIFFLLRSSVTKAMLTMKTYVAVLFIVAASTTACPGVHCQNDDEQRHHQLRGGGGSTTPSSSSSSFTRDLQQGPPVNQGTINANPSSAFSGFTGQEIAEFKRKNGLKNNVPLRLQEVVPGKGTRIRW